MNQIIIVIDAKLKRPACPLLQAVMGGNIHAPNLFTAASWLTSPTPDMKRYATTKEELERFAEIVNKRFPERFPIGGS